MTPQTFTPASLERMRRLWEGSPEISAEAIGERFGVSKSTVIGQANRRGWNPRGVAGVRRKPTTLSQRLDALHLDLDDRLRETERLQ